MAGGSGKRLWPLSRRLRPKQLLPIVGGQSLLSIAVDRLRPVFGNDNIWVVTGAEYSEQVAEELPDLPVGNIIGEPVGRDTANAIALATEVLAGHDGDATMAVFTADHVIRPAEEFARCVRGACDVAEANPDALVTFGVKPTWPHTGLGYIHVQPDSGDQAMDVLEFKEKPDHQAARRYVDTGEYYWNSGMFVWKVSAIRSALKKHLPESMDKLAPAGQVEQQRLPELLQEVYPQLEKISIDYAVMERAENVKMVELTCEWLDVGSWPALQDVCQTDEAGNVIQAALAEVSDSSRNIIVSEDDHLLAVLGVDDCVIVHSPDATLVCGKSDAQRLKELVAELEKRHGERFV